MKTLIFCLLILFTFPAIGGAEEVKICPFHKWRVLVKMTAYTPTVEECDSTPFITASNKMVSVGYVALSRDLEEDFGYKFGDKVVIQGMGVFEFQDRMHARKKRQIDIFMWEKQEALKFGVRTGILVPLRRCYGN